MISPLKYKIKFSLQFSFILVFLSSCETLISIPEKVYDLSAGTLNSITSVFSSNDNSVDETTNSEIDSSLNSPSLTSDVSQDKNQNPNKDFNAQNGIMDDNDFSISDTQQNLNVDETELVAKQEIESPEIVEVEKSEEGQDLAQTEKKGITLQDKQTNNKIQQDILVLKNKIQFKIATINFISGSSMVSSKGRRKIMKVLELAKKNNATVKIVGHASTRTKDMDIISHKLVNFKISDQRAQSVASIFVQNKFPLEKLITEAVSDSKPLFHEVMPAGTNANQRTEIFLIY